jgi:hypothetical protein
MDWSSRGTVLTLLLWSFAGAADADDVFEHPVTADQILKGVLVEPVALINGAQVIRGQFVYKRFLSELPAPLESTGEYLFVKDLGIAWHTEQPFDSEFIVTAAGTTQRDDGKVTLQTSTDEQPAVRAVARILLALLTLDVQALRASFDLYGTPSSGTPPNTRWEIGLRPNIPAVAALFRDATVAGRARVEFVVLHDANGDRTEIQLSNVTYERAAPTALDRQRFVQ